MSGEKEMKAMTVRFTNEEFKKLKKVLIDKEKTFQRYVYELIKKDLNWK